MRKKEAIIPALFLAGTVIVAGEAFDPSILDRNVPTGIDPAPVKLEKSFFNNTAADDSFAFGIIDSKTVITPKSEYDAKPEHNIELLGTQGSYLTFVFAVEVLKNSPSVTVNAVAPSKMPSIRQDDIFVRRIVPAKQKLEISYPPIIPPEHNNAVKGELLCYVAYVNIPKGENTGNYFGRLEISSGGRKDYLDIRLNVLDFELPETDCSFGFFMPATFPGEKRPVNQAPAPVPADYSKAKMDSMFHYWSMLGINSPMLVDLQYPYQMKKDGSIEWDFSRMRLFAETMNKYKMNGCLCSDITGWTFQSRDLAKKSPGFNEQAFLQQGVRALIATAEKEKWPVLRILLEEELGNKYDYKLERYSKFKNALREAAGGRDYVIDNDIGSGHENAIDRGNDDDFRTVQYSSWTEEALRKAKEAKRAIWSYNGGIERGRWGFRLNRIDATGVHQWAEMWGGKGAFFWINLHVSEQGKITPTTLYEEKYKGILDYRCYRMLQSLADQLGKQGKKSAETAARKILSDILQNIPISVAAGQAWEEKQTDASLQQCRYRILLGIIEARTALGIGTIRIPDNVKTSIADAKLSAVPVASEEKSSGIQLIQLPLASDVKLDAECDVKGIYNTTKTLLRTLDKERALRAFSSDEADYQKRIRASYTNTSLYYDEKGLYLHTQINGGGSKYSVCELDNGNPDLWRDPYMEFSFVVPGQTGYYTLLVNSKDKRCILHHGSEKKDLWKDVSVVSKEFGERAHIMQEIFIPWKVFGLKEAPKMGTLWKFNACRSFPLRKETLSWARVKYAFRELDKFGYIKFTGLPDVSLFHALKMKPLQIGKNTVTSQVRPNKDTPITDLEIRILDAGKKVVFSSALGPKTPGWFSYTTEVKQNTPKGDWEIQLVNKKTGTLADRVVWPNEAGDPRMSLSRLPRYGISGNPIRFQVYVPVADGSIGAHPLNVTLVSEHGKTFKLKPLILSAGGENEVILKDLTLEPGNWKLHLELSGFNGVSANGSFTILPRL